MFQKYTKNKLGAVKNNIGIGQGNVGKKWERDSANLLSRFCQLAILFQESSLLLQSKLPELLALKLVEGRV